MRLGALKRLLRAHSHKLWPTGAEGVLKPGLPGAAPKPGDFIARRPPAAETALVNVIATSSNHFDHASPSLPCTLMGWGGKFYYV